MSATLQARLDRLKNYATRYELAATRGDRSILICYASNRSRNAIFRYIQWKADPLTKLTGTTRVDFKTKAADGFMMGEWAIRFTGRTQRECILSNELPFIGDLYPQEAQ
jgi:hypothetical protein